MSISYFAYAVQGDSTADADMVRMVRDPDDMPAWYPYGQEFKGTDGQPLFSGAKTLTLHWAGLEFDTDPEGNPTLVGNVKGFYADWDRARDDHQQRFTVNLFNPITAAWEKHTCVILWPDWSGKEEGVALVEFTITLDAIDVDFDTAPAWGEPNPPAYSEDAATLGDPLVGTIGYGLIGQGMIGEGSDLP
jgi:hypothetical protein